MKEISKILNISYITLIILGIFSVEFFRPKFPNSILLGCLPNFIGAFVLYNTLLFFFEKSIVKKIKNGRFRSIFLGIFIFIFFTIEEFYPFFTASKTFDLYDILASGIGVVFAFFFEHVIKINNIKKN